MQRMGCLVVFIGLLAIIGSCAPMALAVRSAREARVAAEAPLPLGEPVTLTATVDGGRLSQVAVRLQVRTPVAEARPDQASGYRAKYRFPFRYRVLDAAGTVIIEETQSVANDGGGLRTITDDVITADGATMVVQHGLATFAADGAVTVEAHLDADTDHGAELMAGHLRVYHRVSAHGPRLGLAGALLAGGVLAAVLGVILFLAGRNRQRRPVN